MIAKSNLLYRLLYLGERLRTEPCPRHRGVWSGYKDSAPFCDCQYLESGTVGFDVTGWLPVNIAELRARRRDPESQS
jgi:hypothetical protein